MKLSSNTSWIKELDWRCSHKSVNMILIAEGDLDNQIIQVQWLDPWIQNTWQQIYKARLIEIHLGDLA
jgi:hypothetical protein